MYYFRVSYMRSMSEWVPICSEVGDKPVEIETESDGTLPLTSVTAHFPGTTTLKYLGPTGSERAVKLTAENVLLAPSGGWQTAQCYICVNPQKEEVKRKMEIEAQMKRKADVEDQLRGGGVEPERKAARWGQTMGSSHVGSSPMESNHVGSSLMGAVAAEVLMSSTTTVQSYH